MKLRVVFYLAALLAYARYAAAGTLPNRIYGVNLGGWLVLEPWMLPAEWAGMGGENCDDCSQCIGSEFAYVQAFPDSADQAFASHWSTWFNQTHVSQLAALGINSVRIPLGYWIIEDLVDREVEFYPKGGIQFLQQGLGWLEAAGIQVILDHHGLPGVQTSDSSFTGNCTDSVQFYTEPNYQRALVWTAVMTALSHLHTNFSSVFALEAVNEPVEDATQTPGYGRFQKNLVATVRAVELILGIPIPGLALDVSVDTTNVAEAMLLVANSSTMFSQAVNSALASAAPILQRLSYQLSVPAAFNSSVMLASQREPLMTTFMDVNWQYDSPPNPAAAALGPQGYDNHLYYSFGGVAAPNPDAYLQSICTLQRVQADAAVGNTPLWFGEWSLSTEFDATDAFLSQWADAQKLAYSESQGWIFWNFRVESSELAGNLLRQWSYLDGVRLGYLTKDPSQYNDASVCDPYH